VIANLNRLHLRANLDYSAGELVAHDETRAGGLMSTEDVQLSTVQKLV
jgi:hypothetical protein